MKKTISRVLTFTLMLAMVVTALIIPNEEAKAASDYYLIGCINGADHGNGSDWESLTDWKFENGKLTTTFTEDSYIGIKTGDNSNWYWTETYVGSGTEATFVKNASEKAFVKGNIEYTFTLTENSDGTLGLKWEATEEDNGPYYIAGSMNDWSKDSDDYKMTKTDNGFELTLQLAAGEYRFKVTNGTWDVTYPSNDYVFDVVEACDVKFSFDGNNKVSVSGTGVQNAYYIAGEMTGSGWEILDEYKMTYADGSYTYKMTLEAGSYEFKVTDSFWGTSWGDATTSNGNYQLTLTEKSEVTVVLNSNSGLSVTNRTVTPDPAPGTDPTPTPDPIPEEGDFSMVLPLVLVLFGGAAIVFASKKRFA